MAQAYRHADASGGISTPRQSTTDWTAFTVDLAVGTRSGQGHISLDGNMNSLLRMDL